jgi:hypothetical protein
VGCKYDQLSDIWAWFQSNRWAMFAFLVVVGFALCFFGRALVRPTLFLLGIFIATLVIMYIFYSTFLKTDTKTWVAWAVLGGSVFVGLILGFVFQKFPKVGAFALAGWGGFTLGMILYTSFMYNVIGGSLAGYWAFMVGMTLVCGVLAIFLYDHIMIQATALFGSFIFCYGIGMVAGHYPNPFTIQEMIKNGTLGSIDPIYYAYLGGNILMYVLGLVVQYRHKKKNPKRTDYEERMVY